MSLFGYTIKDLEDKLHKKELSVSELVDMSYKRIHEVEENVKSFITLDEENARQKAKELDNQEDKSQPLFGLPSGIKDNLVTKGLRTTCASKILDNFNDPLYDATVVKNLDHAGAVTIGKLNLDEFAMGSTTETSSYMKTRNPWNLDHVPGGSSGGSAAAVASGQVLFSLGTDTGGSIRQPAAFCGIVGMKPTYGLVSRNGLVAMASSLDQIGPMTQNVEDNARILEVIAGHDPLDSTSVNSEVPSYTENIQKDIKGLKIAVPEEYLGEGVSEEIKEAINNALKMYELLGAKVEKVSLPHSAYAASTYQLIAAAEASTGLARFDGIRYGVRSDNATDSIDVMKLSRGEGFGDEVKRRIILGTYVLSAGNYEKYFEKAQKLRTLIRQEFDNVFEKYDVVIGPTAPTTAYKLGDKDIDGQVKMMSDMLTVPVNLAGLPGISIPCGFSSEGLPMGLQIIGKHFDELTLYRAAYAYEQATNHHKRRPTLEGTDQ